MNEEKNITRKDIIKGLVKAYLGTILIVAIGFMIITEGKLFEMKEVLTILIKLLAGFTLGFIIISAFSYYNRNKKLMKSLRSQKGRRYIFKGTAVFGAIVLIQTLLGIMNSSETTNIKILIFKSAIGICGIVWGIYKLKNNN